MEHEIINADYLLWTCFANGKTIRTKWNYIYVIIIIFILIMKLRMKMYFNFFLIGLLLGIIGGGWLQGFVWECSRSKVIAVAM